MAVLLSHLWAVPVPGWLAVQGFFVLSGLLMARIMAETYRSGVKGAGLFLLNRALRLLPFGVYAVAWGALAVGLTGEVASHAFDSAMSMPDTVSGWAANFLMIYPSMFPASLEPRLSPPSWSLTVELLFYALIAAGLAGSRWRVRLWLAGSVAFVALAFALGLEGRWHYSSLPGASLPFAVGAGLHFYLRDTGGRGWLAKLPAEWLVSAVIVNAVLCSAVAAGPVFFAGFYANIVLQTALLAIMFGKGKAVDVSKNALGTRLGEFSYPIYLLHMPLGLLFATAGLPLRETTWMGLGGGVLVLGTSMLAAWPVLWASARWIDPLRARVRLRARKGLHRAPALP